MRKINGYLKHITIDEHSDEHNFDKQIEKSVPHIVWICPLCSTVNINFDINNKIDECDECMNTFKIRLKGV